MPWLCVRHPQAAAGWRCDACDAVLCPRCVGRKETGGTTFDLCAVCGGFARPLLVPRAEVTPFTLGLLLRAFAWPLQPLGLLTMLATGVVLTGLGYLGAGGIGRSVALAFLFQVVRYTALGHDDFSLSHEFRGFFEDVVGPARRLAVALAWVWVPALAWSFATRERQPDPYERQKAAVHQAMRPGGPGVLVHGKRVITNGSGGMELIDGDAPPPPPSPEQLEQEQREAERKQQAAAAPVEAGAAGDDAPEGESRAAGPGESADAPGPGAPEEAAAEQRPSLGQRLLRGSLVPTLLVILGLLLVPISLLVSALDTPLSIAANPLALIGYAWRLGRDYLLLVAFTAAAGLLLWQVDKRGAALLGGVPFSRLPLTLVDLFLALVIFRAIGLLVRLRGADLGYGGEAAYLVPVLGDVQPATLLREGQAFAAARPGAAQPEVVQEPTAPPQRPPPEAIELEPEPLGGRPAPQLFVERLAQRDTEGCLELLERSPKELPANLAEARTWLELAQAALGGDRGRLAALALRRCIDAAPEGTLAPQAWLLAARVYDEKLGDRTTSNRLLQELARRFPESQQGQFAARRLSKQQPGGQ